jgi:hypothetical protein
MGFGDGHVVSGEGQKIVLGILMSAFDAGEVG